MSWVTPLGLPCIQPYRQELTYSVNTVMQSLTLSYHHDDLPIKPQKQKTAFPPNFIHSLDATHMLKTALAAKRKNITFAAVHDSYWTHAGVILIVFVCLYMHLSKLHVGCQQTYTSWVHNSCIAL